MTPELIIGSALFTGLSSFLEGSAEANRKKKIQEDMYASMEDLLITPDERIKRLDMVSDAFNPAILQDINNTAIGNAISGILNPTTYSSLIPERSKAMLSEDRAIDETNRNIEFEMAKIMGEDIAEPNFGTFLTGALQGAGIGFQLDSTLNENERQNRMMKLLETKLTDQPFEKHFANTKKDLFNWFSGSIF